MLTSMLDADALAVIPASDRRRIRRATRVEFELLP